MRVKDLITELQKLNPEYEVKVNSETGFEEPEICENPVRDNEYLIEG